MITKEELAQRLRAQPSQTVLKGRAAAVLIPLLFLGDDAEILFMKRPDGLGAHAGQVSFPGGAREPEDKGVAENALREANEELGIVAADVEVLGVLRPMITVTDFAVTPVVGALRKRPVVTPSAAEVADYFWVPLSLLQNEQAWRTQEMPWRGRSHEVWFFDGAKHLIWGATARMLRDLLALTH